MRHQNATDGGKKRASYQRRGARRLDACSQRLQATLKGAP
jgi:hypothetical protein